MGTDSVAPEVYRLAVAEAERGNLVTRVALPLALYDSLSPADKAWLREALPFVEVSYGIDLTTPRVYGKVTP